MKRIWRIFSNQTETQKGKWTLQSFQTLPSLFTRKTFITNIKWKRGSSSRSPSIFIRSNKQGFSPQLYLPEKWHTQLVHFFIFYFQKINQISINFLFQKRIENRSLLSVSLHIPNCSKKDKYHSESWIQFGILSKKCQTPARQEVQSPSYSLLRRWCWCRGGWRRLCRGRSGLSVIFSLTWQ